MRKFVSLFLVFYFVLSSANLIAKERRGAELLITKKDGKQMKGELIAVKQNSLLLLDPEGADVSIDISDISVITVVKKTKFWKGVESGFIIVGTIAAVTGIGMASAFDPEEKKLFAIAAAWGGVGGVVGGLIGGGISAVAGADKIFQIEGKSYEEIKEALEKLCKKARIPDYK